MDTRFWGPSGWRLLHLISFTYEPEQHDSVKELFTTLPFVLPCKFCRASLAKYMEEDPLDISSRQALSRWLWRIHNMVNEKLRGQGLLKEKNPSFATVQKVYRERIAAGCTKTEFEGWDFLFSIAENHPFSQSAKNSLPLHSEEVQNTAEARNLYNTMESEERMTFYQRFWKSLGGSLPFSTWRSAWVSCDMSLSEISARKTWIKELWRIRCCMENQLDLINRDDFGSLCKRLVDHRSGCGKKKRAKTCRKTRRR